MDGSMVSREAPLRIAYEITNSNKPYGGTTREQKSLKFFAREVAIYSGWLSMMLALCFSAPMEDMSAAMECKVRIMKNRSQNTARCITHLRMVGSSLSTNAHHIQADRPRVPSC